MTVRIELHRNALVGILKSGAVLAQVRSVADRIASAAGPGHHVESMIGQNRARASVRTETYSARRAEAIDRNLTRAVDAGRR